MNQILMKTIVEYAAFLSLSGDDEIHPDSAVVQLEQLSKNLKEMDIQDRQTFVAFTKMLASAARQAKDACERINFLEMLAENLGLE